MRQLNPVFLVFAAFAVLTLVSCVGSSGGYSARPWEQTQQSPAEQPPSNLSAVYGSKQTEAGARTGVDMTEAGPSGMQPKGPITEPLVNPQESALAPVKVAILLPLSGQHANLGESMLKAAQIALFDAGYDGFELLPKDTQGTQQGAQMAAQSAVSEGAQLVLGPVFADAVRGAKPVTQRANINMIAFSTDWGLAGDNTFIMGFLPFDQVERITEYAANHNIGHIGVIAPGTSYGRAVVSAYQSMSRQRNINTVDTVTFAPNTANLSPTMRSFTKYDERTLPTNAGPNAPSLPPPFDAVLMPVGGDTAISISNLLTHYDMPPRSVKRLGTGLFDDPALASEVSLQGAVFAAPSPDARKSFEKRFIETYSYAAPRLATLAYDSTALAAILARRGLQTHQRPAFDRASIANPNGFSGIDGIFRFRQDGTVERGLAVLEISNGTFRVIEDAPKTFQQYAPF